ncbi:uncharacterized protein LOC123477577 [Daphnia magna]|uniref:uncharacterized protein LOC123477577 n=1 Tax=Daphnia magna TaxID=35525 RepID=UPI001E1BD34E|nr:uncharacterized protein LOC123477577 [Daphnia magna]
MHVLCRMVARRSDDLKRIIFPRLPADLSLHTPPISINLSPLLQENSCQKRAVKISIVLSSLLTVLQILMSYDTTVLLEMPRCVIIGCRNGYKNKIVLASRTDIVEKESKFTLFYKPSDQNVSKVWEDKIPKEDGAVLPNRYAVCHEHFDESQIIKSDVTIINGEEIKLPRRWKLVVGAFPTIFTGTPVELFLKKAVRKPPTVQLPLGNITNYTTHHYGALKKERTVKKKGSTHDGANQDVDTNSADSLLKEKQQEEQVEFDELEPKNKQFSADEARHVELPSSSWYVSNPTADSCNFFEVVAKDGTTRIEKDVNIDFKNLTVSVTYHSRKVPSFEGSWFPSTSKDMEASLLSIHKSKICPGIMHNPLKHPHHSTVVRNGNLITNIWRANSCRLMIASNEETKKTCPCCKLLDLSLRKQLKRQKTVKDHTKLNHRYMSLKQLAKKVRQTGKNESQLKIRLEKKNIQIKELKLKIKELRVEIASIKKDKLQSILDELDDKGKLVVKTIVTKARCRDKHCRDMRYDVEWLLECLLIRVKSPATYEHLRINNIIPLPCKDTLRKMTSSLACEFGFNDFAIECIRKHFKNKSLTERYGSLMWDEMSIMQDIRFDKNSFQYKGFTYLYTIFIIRTYNNTYLYTDFEEDETNFSALDEDWVEDEDNEDGSTQETSTTHLADHALVLVFRPYRARWIQPISVFASKSAASGVELQKIVMKALVILEEVDARVLTTVCDGSSPNNSLWTAFGISGSNTDKVCMKNSIKHPTADTNIYFLRDAPHLFKCIRNHIFNHKDVQASGKTIKYSDLLNLFKHDTVRCS